MRAQDELLEKLDEMIALDAQTMQNNIDIIDSIRNISEDQDPLTSNKIVRFLQNIFGKIMRKLYMPTLRQQEEINMRLMCVAMDLNRMQKNMEERAVIKMQIATLGDENNGTIEYKKDAFREYHRLRLEKHLLEHELYNTDRASPCIIQVVATVNFGDAVGNDAIAIKNMLKKEGIITAIFAETIHPRVQDEDVLPICYLPELREDDMVIYHFAAADMNIGLLRRLKCKKILRYHNVTPPEFFEPYDEVATEITSVGLKQIEENRDIFDCGLIVSDYNVKDLRKMGYTCPMEVAPILIPFEDYAKEPDSEVIEKYSDGITNILFVGRGAPNKRIEDVIRAFKEYKENYDKQARLFLVGNYDEEGAYTKCIRNMIAEEEVEDVIFSGHISFASILAYYKIADVFLCMSEHEGFGVPLVEAMYFDVPIVAYNATAVPDTLGNAGIIIYNKEWEKIAAQISEIVTNKEKKDQIIDAQRKQLQCYNNKVIEKKMLQTLKKFSLNYPQNDI